MALFYNLFCCGALRFTDYNCLGNAYILNTNSPSLAVVGSAKSGSMLDFRFFYEPIGLGCSFGKAFQKWFEHEYPYNEGDVNWFYGMTILGDPTLIPFMSFGVYANGPYYGLIDEPIHFRGSARGGVPQYTWYWDFGDTYTSDEQNPTHVYTEAGNYTVTLTVTDDGGNSTDDTTWAWIQESNDHPDKPFITGETNGKAGTKYDYTFVTNDPEGLKIWHYIEWGDGTDTGWIGPYLSGTEITKSHSWSKKDTYAIRCKAKDPYDAESEWAYLEVTMPKNKPFNFNYPLSSWLFERFPWMLPILRHLLLGL
jgi:hypothetical protein